MRRSICGLTLTVLKMSTVLMATSLAFAAPAFAQSVPNDGSVLPFPPEPMAGKARAAAAGLDHDLPGSRSGCKRMRRIS